MNNIAGALYRVIKIKNEKRNEMGSVMVAGGSRPTGPPWPARACLLSLVLIWTPDPEADHFMPLLRGPLVPFVKCRIDEMCNGQWTDGQTDR